MRAPKVPTFALVVAGALIGFTLSIPLFDWLHANFEFMR